MHVRLNRAVRHRVRTRAGDNMHSTLAHPSQLRRLTLRVFGLAIPLLLTACAATDPADDQPPVQPTITINTIPSGADVSIQGNYVGVSPLAVNAPSDYRSNEP